MALMALTAKSRSIALNVRACAGRNRKMNISIYLNEMMGVASDLMPFVPLVPKGIGDRVAICPDCERPR